MTIFEKICDPNGNFVYATNGNSPGTGVQVNFVDPGTGYPSQSGPLTSPFGQAYVLKPIFATMAVTKQDCPVSITYRPLGVGTRQATLSITDSPGSPQIIPLMGTSVAPPTPTPVAPFTPPGTFNIPGTVTVGMTSSPQNLLLTNTGNAPMHVTNIVPGGVNMNDFSLGTATCVGTLAANANCSNPIIFAPVAAGIRSSTITVTDDAPASPQVVVVNGTAAQPVSIGAAGNGGTSASVAAGQTAQFLLRRRPDRVSRERYPLLARHGNSPVRGSHWWC